MIFPGPKINVNPSPCGYIRIRIHVDEMQILTDRIASIVKRVLEVAL